MPGISLDNLADKEKDEDRDERPTAGVQETGEDEEGIISASDLTQPKFKS